MSFGETMTAVNFAIGTFMLLSGAYITVRHRVRLDENERWIRQLTAQRDDCERREARLSGQLEAVTSDFLEKLTERVTRATISALGETIRRAPRRLMDPDDQDWR